jgi:hypothetical protein
VPGEDWATLLHRQALIVTFAPDEAMAALPTLLPTLEDREQALALASAVLMSESELADPQSAASRYVHALLHVDPARVADMALALSVPTAATTATVSIAASTAPRPARRRKAVA